jgi:hypothetical protein
MLCGQQQMTIAGFVTDGGFGYDRFHEQQNAWNLTVFNKAQDVPMVLKYQAISDGLPVLKRARCRLLKTALMVIGLLIEFSDLNLDTIVSLLHDDLPLAVSSNDPIRKIHGSLPMLWFRFEILLNLYAPEQFGWLTCFFPWILLNEAMSDKIV